MDNDIACQPQILDYLLLEVESLPSLSTSIVTCGN
jgi:hypothetical protein